MAGTLQGRRLAWVVLALPAALEHTESLDPEAMAGKEATTVAFHLLVVPLPESLGLLELPGCRCQSRQKNPLLMTHQSQFRQQTFPLN
jgi:hypothetical protein